MRVHIRPSLIGQLILYLLSVVPYIQSWAKLYFPEWFLPPTVIVKKIKPDCDDEFDKEKNMYKRLEAFQGVVIPMCYGETRCDGVPALLLSDIGGFPLYDARAASIQEDDLLRMFHDAFAALAGLGILHDDTKLDNYHLVGDKIMIVDLEQADEAGLAIDFLVDSTIRHLVSKYKSHQACLEEDGLL